MLNKVILLLFLFSISLNAQQRNSTLRGEVKDQFNAAVVGASVVLTDSTGRQVTTVTNNEGIYTFRNLLPGKYSLVITATGFGIYENNEVTLQPGPANSLNVNLEVSLESQEVDVLSNSPVSTSPEDNPDAVILKGADLEALPDDPDELAAALQALAGPAAGPNGGQIYIDGFTGSNLPPKESIREIRINQNPFSAEFDRLGFGRVEIFTKPGTDKLRGNAFFNFNDESLNSRNPFAPNRPPYQVRHYGGSLSGPIIPRKSSFFFDFERRDEDDNDVISATILNDALGIVPFNLAILTPEHFMRLGPRLDYQLSPNHTLVGRYNYNRRHEDINGIGNFSLLSRGFSSRFTDHTFQLTETAVLDPTVINETRFQFTKDKTEQVGDNTTPSIDVLGSFFGGGSTIGESSTETTRIEIHNNTTWSTGNHTVRGGLRIRRASITSISRSNFGGTYTFAGGSAPDISDTGAITNATLSSITAIERYRRTRLFSDPASSLDPAYSNLSAADLQARGALPSQFSIIEGDPLASIKQWDLGLFLQDDWRVRPNLTLNLGLRYEWQNNIESNANFAPRVAFAWAPGSGQSGPPKTVIRAGIGLFYERFLENYSLQALRYNGINQQQYIVTDAQSLASYPALPSTALLAALPQTIWRVSDNLEAPYTIQYGVNVSRQLPRNITVYATAFKARTLHALRARSVNAPVLETGLRPTSSSNEIYQYESSGVIDQSMLIVGLNSRFTRRFTLYGNYSLGRLRGDTDGAGSFPAYSYNLLGEYGRASFDVRHRLFLSGSYSAPWRLNVSPFIIYRSGMPFNIITGEDTNDDQLFTERPAFATDLTRPSVIATRFGTFDTDPIDGQQIIPRNYGEGPSFFTVNLRLSRTFGFGNVARPKNQGTADTGAQGNERVLERQLGGGQRGPGGGTGRRGGGGGAGGGGGRGGGGGGMGGFSDELTEKRYNLTFSVYFQNLFNKTNLGTPIGNLSSDRFGLANSTAGGFGFGGGGGGGASAGNRRVQLQVRFAF
jgi:hypothetical protein